MTVEERAEYNRKYYQANKERHRELADNWRKNNLAKWTESSKPSHDRWEQEHRAERLEYKRRKYFESKERLAEVSA